MSDLTIHDVRDASDQFDHLFAVTINGKLYAGPRPLQWKWDTSDRLAITTLPPTHKAINICDHCHRADWVEMVAHSVQEAIDLGWLVAQ